MILVQAGRSMTGNTGAYWYGLDPQTGQLVHVHVFSRLLTGESFVKSHLFPFEPMLLENADFIGPIRVTAKPAEGSVYLRTFIKYGSLLDLMGQRRDSEAIQRELCWLRTGAICPRHCLLESIVQ
jgi:hypothetical protein